MKRFSLCLLFLFPILANSQTEENLPNVQNAGDSFITFNLLTPFDPFSPRYRLGFVQALNQSWRLGLDVGYGNEAVTLNGASVGPGEDYELFEIRPEMYYILNPGSRANHYFSAEVFYIHHRETFLDNAYEPENGGRDIEYESAAYLRKKYGFHVKYGLVVPFGEQLGMDFYIGAGLRVRENSFSEVVAAEDPENDEYQFLLFDIPARKEGAHTAPNFALGAKFFYRF